MLTISTVVVNVLNYFFHVLSARALGPDDYSEIVTLFSYLALFGIPFSTITPLLIRRLGYAGDSRIQVASAFESWFVSRIRHWWFLIPIAYSSVLLLPTLTNLKISTSIVLIFVITAGLISSVYFALLQGLQLFKESSIIAVITSFIKLGGVLFVFFGIGGLSIIYLGLGLSIVLGICYALLTIRKLKTFSKHTHYTFDKRAYMVLTDPSTIATTASLLGITLIGNADIAYIKRFFTDTDAGLYGAWSLFAKTILYVLSPISALSLVYFSAKETQHRQKIALIMTIGILFVSGVGAYIAYTLFSNDLIQVILSPKFISISPYLPKAALFGILYASVNILNNYFVAKKNKAQLIGIISSPLYIGALVLFGKTLDRVISINIIYCLAITIMFACVIFVEFKPKATQAT